MKVLTSLDLAKNPLLNFVPEKRSTAPSNPVEGQAYYDTTDKTFKQYDGTTWKVIGSTYVLPTASADTLGGVKVGNGLAIDQNGVLSVVAIEFETAYNASTNKAATMADIAAAITALGNVIELKGTKATVSEIEAIQNPEVGDMWICTADNSEWLYLSTGWEDLGHTIDLSGYIIKASGSIGIASSSETITLSAVTTPEIISVNAYIISNGIREEVTIETSYDSSTKILTCTSNGHEVAVNIEVFYKETSI